MTDKPRLLIVDDEAPLRRALRASFAAAGFEVSEAASGEEALRLAEGGGFDLVLLDINLGGLSGVEVCRRMRAAKLPAGILMVTVRDSENDKVSALDAGADDFVTKPFRLRELLARSRAVLRRLRPTEARDTVLHAGDLIIDFERRHVEKGGQAIHLTPTEFDVLALLAKSKGAPVRHAKILQQVWGPEYGGELEYLRTYVRALRGKIEDNPARPRYIITEPWLGYRFEIP